MAVVVFVFRTEACLGFAGAAAPLVPRASATTVVNQLRARRHVGLGAIRAPRLLVPIFALSILQWLAGARRRSTCSMRAVACSGHDWRRGAVLLLNVIGLTLPAAPGHVGTVQLAFIVGLAPFGVARESAFAASVIYNVLMVVPTVILGLPGLRQAGAALQERLASR